MAETKYEQRGRKREARPISSIMRPPLNCIKAFRLTECCPKRNPNESEALISNIETTDSKAIVENP